jgi:hypothetical protein
MRSRTDIVCMCLFHPLQCLQPIRLSESIVHNHARGRMHLCAQLSLAKPMNMNIYSSEFQNAWSFTSTFSYAFTAWYLNAGYKWRTANYEQVECASEHTEDTSQRWQRH